ncbi:hypothetical protein ACFXI8_32360 [Streptomyces niveus]|uniref:hypothetical protein n=1 Tax=Streptomyces niveus TaxID=193462 RepID=UPI0036C67096
MRTVFVFPAGERAETIASLDRHLPRQHGPWTLPEIVSRAVIDGLRFFDFRGYHELNRDQPECS